MWWIKIFFGGVAIYWSFKQMIYGGGKPEQHRTFDIVPQNETVVIMQEILRDGEAKKKFSGDKPSKTRGDNE